MTTNDALDARSASDYGLLDRDACDIGLRQRVIGMINNNPGTDLTLNSEQRAELATYITQLEDALLRHHWGVLEPHRIHEILQCSTGLDMESMAQALADMASVDA